MIQERWNVITATQKESHYPLPIAIRVDVSMGNDIELLAQLPGICEISIMRENDPIRTVDVEGLRFSERCRSRGRVADWRCDDNRRVTCDVILTWLDMFDSGVRMSWCRRSTNLYLIEKHTRTHTYHARFPHVQ